MKRILSLILCLMMVISLRLSPVLAADAINESDAPVIDTDPSVGSYTYAAIVLDMKTGNVLYEHDADEKNYPASCTKIMTSLLALKHGDLDDIVTVTDAAYSDLSAQASTWDLKVGEEMSLHQLLKCILVVSASEGANVAGVHIGGTLEKFVEMMNEEAAALGCENTHFMNCHGLPRSQHYTTARDLATIAMAAMEYDTFREIVGSAITELYPTNYHGGMSILSTNGLLPGSTEYGGKYNYPYAMGIKTGHTSVAGYNLVSAANKDGIEILTVVMGCGSRESSFAQTVKLFEWTYENYETLSWDWTDHTATEKAPEELEEAPEYEEIETSVIDEEEVVIVEGNPIVVDLPQEELPADAPSSEEVSSVPEEVVDAEEAPALTFSDLTDSSMAPVLLCFAIALLLLIILVIILVVLVTKKSRKKKKRKKRRKK